MAARTVCKGGAFIAADLAGLGVEGLLKNCTGMKPEDAEAAGRGVSFGATLGVGLAVGGPAGALVGIAVWLFGEVVASFFS